MYVFGKSGRFVANFPICDCCVATGLRRCLNVCSACILIMLFGMMCPGRRLDVPLQMLLMVLNWRSSSSVLTALSEMMRDVQGA